MEKTPKTKELKQGEKSEMGEKSPISADQVLNVNDVKIVVKALTLAASRGAFKIEEYSILGGAYDRVNAFLNNHTNKGE